MEYTGRSLPFLDTDAGLAFFAAVKILE